MFFTGERLKVNLQSRLQCVFWLTSMHLAPGRLLLYLSRKKSSFASLARGSSAFFYSLSFVEIQTLKLHLLMCVLMCPQSGMPSPDMPMIERTSIRNRFQFPALFTMGRYCSGIKLEPNIRTFNERQKVGGTSHRSLVF